jgi:formylglycine-generating enzyme required for sulfatase activity
VINISWRDARDYAAWLAKMTGQRYRLLSEAEWEYAARAATTTRYFWGDAAGAGHANCTGCGGPWDGKSTAPVGSFPPNGFGLFDMAGNVWQYVADCASATYVGAPADGSAWMAGDCAYRGVRGGSWRSVPKSLRASNRDKNSPTDRDDSNGFHVARSLSPQ